jgi:hypothetical protein
MSPCRGCHDASARHGSGLVSITLPRVRQAEHCFHQRVSRYLIWRSQDTLVRRKDALGRGRYVVGGNSGHTRSVKRQVRLDLGSERHTSSQRPEP